jgi:hypothetical protein
VQRLLLSHSQPGFGQGGADLGEFMQVGQLVELQVALLNLFRSPFGSLASGCIPRLCSAGFARPLFLSGIWQRWWVQTR